MKALAQHRSLRQRLSWWLALQSFAGLRGGLSDGVSGDRVQFS